MTTLGWTSDLAHKALSVVGTNGNYTTPALIAQSEKTTDVTDSGVTIDQMSNTGLSIERTVGSKAHAFKIFIAGEMGVPGPMDPKNGYLVIKDVDKTTYLFYASQNTINLGTFTGSHLSRISPGDSVLTLRSPDLIGRIVSSTGSYSTIDHIENKINDNKFDAITINESHPIVELCNTIQDTTVYGVVSSFEATDSNYNAIERSIQGGGGFSKSISIPNGDKGRVIVNSLGEGAIWVCDVVLNDSGKVANGDYICSHLQGYGKRQANKINYSYTIAKLTCECDFNNNVTYPTNLDGSTNTAYPDVSKYKGIRYLDADGETPRRAAFLGCIYMC